MSTKNWLIILLTYGSIFMGAWTSTQVKSDFSLTTLSARSSEDYQNFQRYSKLFPIEGNGLVLSVGLDEKFETLESFALIEALREDLQTVSGVKSALGITSLEIPEKSLFGSKSKLLLPLDENKFQKRFSKINHFSDVTPKFLSDDRTATRVFLTVDWSELNISEIKKTVEKYAFTEFHLMGKEVFSDELKQSLEAEMMVLPLIAGVILLFLFFLWFRDFKSVFVVASVLMVNLSLLYSVFYLSGIKIGLLTSTTPLLILVLSFSDIVHILYKFKQLNAGSLDERLEQTMKPLQLPLWLTTLTTAVAFALFFISGIDEIMEFAFSTCLGILFAYLTARFLLPRLLVIFRIRSFKKRSGFSWLADQLIGLLRFKFAVVGSSLVVLIALSVYVFSRFEINSSFHQNFGSNTQLGKSLRFADAHFEGVRTIEVILESKNGLSPSTISKVDEIEKELIEKYGCRSVFSVNTAIKRLNRYHHFGKASQFKLPANLDKDFLSDLNKYRKELGLINAMTNDQLLYRIVGRLPDIGSAKAREKNQLLQAKLEQLEDANHQMFISGFSYVKDQSTTRITGFILIGIALSLVVTMIVIGIVFRSVKIAFIAFFPNYFPLIFGLSLMYCFGIELNPTTAMALSISLGLALDDTIYLLSTIKRTIHLKPSESIVLSLKENTFPAAVTSLILIIGFGVLMLSSIESNQNIGLLVATMLFIALISDLVILPALLRIFWNKRT